MLLEKFKKGEMMLVLWDLTELEMAVVKTLPETHIERGPHQRSGGFGQHA